jgi:HEPN domain-containing protein
MAEPFHDEQCFHCQQSAVKYLKSLLEELGAAIPKIHNLIALLALLVPHYGSVRALRRGADFLTRFAIETRYPGDSASKRQAASALRWAGRVRAECRQLLGLASSGPGGSRPP